jgi:hypothetical protein
MRQRRACVGRSERVIRFRHQRQNQNQGQRARAPTLHDYTARVSRRPSQSDEVRATAFMFYIFYFGFLVEEEDNYGLYPPPDLR